MNKKVIRQFAEQFGKEWECTCKAPFGIASLEVISESDTSLLAHYICPSCGREQMLAASITGEKTMEELSAITFNQLTSDDVLDIRAEIRAMRPGSLKSFHKVGVKKETIQPADQPNPPSKTA